MTETERVIAWNSLIDHSLELCRIRTDGDLRWIEGDAVMVEGRLPVSLSYSVEVNSATGSTAFEGRIRMGSAPERSLALRGAAGGGWKGSENARAARTIPLLHGACCIDLGWTPLTNTFAIWHLDLPVGGTGLITAAWVPFPILTPKPARQRYTRLEDHRYRYEQPEIDFAADLEVDNDGFVVRYGDIWERLPTG